MLVDMPLSELRAYKPKRNEPSDFDTFWESTLKETRSFPLDAVFKPADFGITTMRTYDLSFNGYQGQQIKGWFLVPINAMGTLPCVVEYIGYGGGRGFPLDWLSWSSAGYCHLIMDTRGQGSSWQNGDTPDHEPLGSSPSTPGFMTRGILDPQAYYYRRLITDAVRAIEAALSNPIVDPDRIAVTGASQGGGLSLIASSLMPQVNATMPDVPFLCHYQHATEITDAAPYSEITTFCKIHRSKIETVFNTLSYFDGVNFATRSNAKALFSVGLMDTICPPSTVFAAFNHYAGEKDISVYSYNHHEGGGTHHLIKKIQYLNKLMF
ncbi:MAG: acetylxylan esterase [Anaerolineaceae bacterium]|nr:acetylxylan esterase [Anaerolineaceae bacterium]